MIGLFATGLIVAAIPLAVLIWAAWRLERRWEKLFWLLAIVLACVNYRLWAASRFDGWMGLDVALAMYFTGTSLLLFTVPLLVRLVAVRTASFGARAPHHPAGDINNLKQQVASDWLAAIVLAAVLPSMFLIWFGLLARMTGFVAFTLVAFGALVCVLGYRRFRWPDVLLKRICAVGALTFLAIGLGALGSALFVHRSADRIAAGRPYCIQSGVTPVRTVLDLSVLTMRERPVSRHGGPLYLRNHAILMVDYPSGRQVFNWSYAGLNFKDESRFDSPDVSSRPTIVCSPTTAGGMAWL